jgi:hypothetical protein
MFWQAGSVGDLVCGVQKSKTMFLHLAILCLWTGLSTFQEFWGGKGMFLLELFRNSVFLVGIGWYFLGILQTDTKEKLGWYILVLQIWREPLFHSKGGHWPPF